MRKKVFVLTSSSGFTFPIDFMTDTDAAEIAAKIAEISPGWCKVDSIYKPNGREWERKDLCLEESGVDEDDLVEMMEEYIAFVLRKYPEADVQGRAHYDQMNAEGHYEWEFTIIDEQAHVKYISEPMDPPSYCPECAEDIEIDTDLITEDNYESFSYICPNCGYAINTYDDYEITVEEWHYTKKDFEEED